MSASLGLGLGPMFQAGVRRGAFSIGSIPNWASGPVTGKKLLFWGDSTSHIDLAAQMYAGLTQATAPGGVLEGVTVIPMGSNGQTQEGANSDVTNVTDETPDLVVQCFLINDTRTGSPGVTELASRLQTGVDEIRAILPDVEIVLWAPNPMLTNDATGLLVIPEAAACQYNHDIRDAYKKLAGKNPGTLYVSKADAFGVENFCVDTSPYMTDSDPLHPNEAGQYTALRGLVLPYLLPPAIPIDETASKAAWLADPNEPWAIYSRAMEDTRYSTHVYNLAMGTYLDLGTSILAYIGRTWDDPGTIEPEDMTYGSVLLSPVGGYRWKTTENAGDYNTTAIQISQIAPADWPMTSAPENMKLYHVDLDWTDTMAENAEFTVTEDTQVRFGADVRWFNQLFTAGTYTCDGTTFGGDPAPFTAKTCQKLVL